MTNRSLFRRAGPSAMLRAQTDAEVDLLLYDEIGFWGVTAKDMASALAQIDAETIHLRINSPGGDVFDGVAIHNQLKAHPARVVTHIDGLAASIASVIALAGDEVRIAPNAFYMVHNPWGVTIGDAILHRKMADTLDKLAESAIASTYMAKTGENLEVVQTWMDDETWFNAEEAKAAGFADVVEDSAATEATDQALPFDLSVYANVPQGLRYGAPDAMLSKQDLCDLDGILKSAGLSHTQRDRAVAAVRQWLQRSPGVPESAPRPVGVAPETDAEQAARDLLAALCLATVTTQLRK